MVLTLMEHEQAQLNAIVRHNPDAGLVKRATIVLCLAMGIIRAEVARAVSCHPTTVDRVKLRFLWEGVFGLYDRRKTASRSKVPPSFLAELASVVKTSPREHGWANGCWTGELLALEMEHRTKLELHRSTITRLLHQQDFSYVRARPILISPDPNKEAILLDIESLKGRLGPDEVLVYEDEMDVHLNPRIGPQWTPKGQQATVVTPGKNVKRYVAGALDYRTGQITWVTSDRKRSLLFIALVEKLVAVYPAARRIHIVCDNYIIHKSKITQKALAKYGDKVVIHFLPTYSPEHNPIERLWKDLHACVTRNHDAKDVEELLARVESYLLVASPYPGSKPSLARAS